MTGENIAKLFKGYQIKRYVELIALVLNYSCILFHRCMKIKNSALVEHSSELVIHCRNPAENKIRINFIFLKEKTIHSYKDVYQTLASLPGQT